MTDTPSYPRLPAWLRVLLAPVILSVAIFVPQLVWMVPPLRALTKSLPESALVPLFLLTLVATTAVAVGLLALVARYVDGLRLRDYGWYRDPSAVPGFFLGLLVSVVIVVASGLILRPFGLLREPSSGSSAGLWVTVIVALGQAFFLQGIPEELLFRGYVVRTLQRYGIVRAVWISVIVFALLHLASQGGQENVLERILYLAWPFGFALAAGGLRLTTGSLWAAVGIHGGSHVGTLITNQFGMGEGPAMWLLVGVLYTVVGLVALRRYQGSQQATAELSAT